MEKLEKFLYENAGWYFRSHENRNYEELRRQRNILNSFAELNELIDGMPEPAFILNTAYEIIANNSRVETLLSDNDNTGIIGKKISGVINCNNTYSDQSECTKEQHCKDCGLAKAFAKTKEKDEEAIEEVSIAVINSYNQKKIFILKIFTKPITIRNEKFILLSLKDISAEKRRETLEKIFFHDALNTAGVLTELTAILSKEEDSDKKKELIECLFNSANQLFNELSTQRDLSNAEDGNLYLLKEEVSVNCALKYVHDLYSHSLLTHERNFSCSILDNDIKITTDRTMLTRALGNLVKNALEASSKGDTIKVFIEVTDLSIKFHVYNPSVIPQEFHEQIFQRSFSTKALKGRGLGTYSVKLIVEQYLLGKVYFVSEEEIGTIFTIEMPLRK